MCIYRSWVVEIANCLFCRRMHVDCGLGNFVPPRYERRPQTSGPELGPRFQFPRCPFLRGLERFQFDRGQPTRTKLNRRINRHRHALLPLRHCCCRGYVAPPRVDAIGRRRRSLPRLRPQQRHPSRPDALIERRPRCQPCCRWAAATAPCAPHLAQDFAHSDIGRAARCQCRERVRPLAATLVAPPQSTVRTKPVSYALAVCLGRLFLVSDQN